MARTLTRRGQHLASAALAIAKVNHYLVGWSAQATGSTFEDFTDAHLILVETEGQSRTISRAQFDRAFMVLDFECFAQHRTHLGL